MRPKRTVSSGLVRRLGMLLAGGLGLMALATTSTASAALQTSSNELMVVLESGSAAQQAVSAMTALGYSELEPLGGVPARFGPCLLVKVPSTGVSVRTALLSVPGVKAVRPVYRHASVDWPILSTGQVVARFQPGTTLAQVRAIAATHDCAVARPMSGLPQTYVFNVLDPAKTARECAQGIALTGNPIYSHESLMYRLTRYQAAPIEDPLYPWQWHLHNTGQLEDATVDADIDAPEAWAITEGFGAIVAVIDDSIQKDHEDLTANYLTGFDFVDADGDPSPYYGPYDPDPVSEAHGTAVSGLICAAANSIGVRGVAPQASLIGCKIGFGPAYSSDQDIADAFTFAEQNGAMAINNSWGGPGVGILPLVPNDWWVDDLLKDAITEVSTNGRGGLGVLVLFAAGNESLPIVYGNAAAALPEVMSIGGILRDETFACYSNFGPEQSVVAPTGGAKWGSDQPYVSTCLDPDMTTTDNMETTGYGFDYIIIEDADGDGEPDDEPTIELIEGESWPIRGYNPPMKFLSGYDYLPGLCPPLYDASFGICVPLVPDHYALEELPDVNYSRRFSGTSAACPVATGVATLVFSVNPGLTAENVRNIVEHTAQQVVSRGAEYDAVTGHNEQHGHGRVNAYQAVRAATSGYTWPSPVTEVQNASSQARAVLFWTNPDNGVAGVLVVRGSTGVLNWAPEDGVAYTLGQQVAPGVVVVSTDAVESLDQTGLPAGSYEYGIFVRNLISFYSWGRRASFDSEGSVSTPLASLSASPKAGQAPLTVHFAGGAIDATGTRDLAFAWNFGDGTAAFGSTADHSYTVPGNYIVTLTVTNTSGQTAQATTVISVSAEFNVPPGGPDRRDAGQWEHSPGGPVPGRRDRHRRLGRQIRMGLWRRGDGDRPAGRAHLPQCRNVRCEADRHRRRWSDRHRQRPDYRGYFGGIGRPDSARRPPEQPPPLAARALPWRWSAPCWEWSACWSPGGAGKSTSRFRPMHMR